jgi:hypothetical protein
MSQDKNTGMKDNIANYIKGTICRNTSTGQEFVCSGKYSIDEYGLWDTENLNYIYMPEGESWADVVKIAGQ